MENWGSSDEFSINISVLQSKPQTTFHQSQLTEAYKNNEFVVIIEFFLFLSISIEPTKYVNVTHKHAVNSIHAAKWQQLLLLLLLLLRSLFLLIYPLFMCVYFQFELVLISYVFQMRFTKIYDTTTAAAALRVVPEFIGVIV